MAEAAAEQNSYLHDSNLMDSILRLLLMTRSSATMQDVQVRQEALRTSTHADSDSLLRYRMHLRRRRRPRVQRIRLLATRRNITLPPSAADGDRAVNLYHGGRGKPASPAERLA